jgi:Bacterial regulatory helix-turn-helix protein, lysR family
MHLNPESLSFALLISDLGSIARAANILGMKQATLSRKLTALESGRGSPLRPIDSRSRAYRLWGRVSESSAPDRGGSGHTPHLESRSGKW